MVSNLSKTLIHTALLCEAQPIIQYLKLLKNKDVPNMYENETHILMVSGIGKTATLKALTPIFNNYPVKKAINIGIAGCKDNTLAIGTLCCTTHALNNIVFTTLSTHESAIDNNEALTTVLVDMEAQYFFDVCKSFVPHESIYCLKVVSDYLSTTIPTKEFVSGLIQKNMALIKEIV